VSKILSSPLKITRYWAVISGTRFGIGGVVSSFWGVIVEVSVR